MDFNPLPSCEGRRGGTAVFCPPNYFNPLPSCEGRPYTRARSGDTILFQSTPLMRGETSAGSPAWRHRPHFNPLPSCEGRPSAGYFFVPVSTISIHSPHARGDLTMLQRRNLLDQFQSTPLMRGETWAVNHLFTIFRFQSTPLMRGETQSSTRRQTPEAFQSTPLMRGETRSGVHVFPFPGISIHSPHARGDQSKICFARLYHRYFNPLPSCEGRR